MSEYPFVETEMPVVDMRTQRGFIVWGAGAAVVLGLFLYFVFAGWPGAPNACVYDSPDTCYCEAFDLTQVEAGAPGVRQPVNTWFNLYALITSMIVAVFVFNDRKMLLPGAEANVMQSQGGIPDLYIFAVQFLGLGSMWFHGSLTEWGGVVDGLSMYVFAAFLPFYSIRRIWRNDTFFWTGYVTTVTLFTYLHAAVLPAFVNILILVAFYLIVEVSIWIKTRQIMMGDSDTMALWLFAVGCIGAASFFWWASHTGNFLCDPNSFFQPHGLLWHPFAGISAVLMYFYWRSERAG